MPLSVSPESAPQRGRPRSKEATSAVYQAVLSLAEEQGYRGLTIEAISARSGVGRPTIYRWWKNKGELLSEAYLERAGTNPRFETPDHGSLLGDLLHFLPRLAANLAGPDGNIVLAVMVEAQLVPDFEDGFRRMMEHRWKVSETLFERALSRGELEAMPTPAVYDLIYGALFYRLLSRRAPLDEAFGSELAHRVAKIALPPY